MPKKTKVAGLPEANLQDLQTLLADFSSVLEKEEDVRQRVLALIPSFYGLRKLGISLLPDVDENAARARILKYFQKYQGNVLDGDELMVVSGISEWARRVRELRVEFGWKICSGVTFEQMSQDDPATLNSLTNSLGVDPTQLKPSQYVLVSSEQDRDAAYRWRLLNQIRKKNAAVKTKLEEYFLANVGKQISGEELRYLAKDRNEWARRVRELRTEEGWSIATRQTGRPDLPVGVYILQNDLQAEPHDRKIKDDVRVAVLERDNFCCQFKGCGWRVEDAKPGDPRHFLELHHKQHHHQGGSNDAENLVTLCNVHHDAVHRDKNHKFY
ncbi:HNH endonuclease [Thalassobius sp. MITS945101]|uniref:HNH endonuclease n=1 Tax=Thalassobius sp. MITS945101 TaxID=3096994 RepID=UPI003999A2BE